jgi:hypothetical protein
MIVYGNEYLPTDVETMGTFTRELEVLLDKNYGKNNWFWEIDIEEHDASSLRVLIPSEPCTRVGCDCTCR